MSDGAYAQFLARTAEAAYARRTPVNGSYELTFRCNLSCVMCYNALPGNHRDAKANEMTLDEIKRIFDQLADAGCLWLQLTGGEVLMRPDFKDIYLYAKSKGFLIRLFTNGTMLTPAMADFLAEHRPFAVEISLYGATEETYEAVTRVRGSYKKCLRGIRLLLKRGLPLSLKTVAITLNQHELGQMQTLCDELGVRFRYDPDINPRIDGDRGPLAYRLTPEQVVALDRQTPPRARELSESICAAAPPPAGADAPLYACAAGETAFHIDPAGQMTPCIMTRRGGYDLCRGDFDEAWQQVFPGLRAGTRRVGEDEPSGYSHCTGWAQLENDGDGARAVAHAALVARLREKAFARTRADLLMPHAPANKQG
ncbi:MAG: radical SAM protein [Armatimonadetes bacterium]|nr:radical SAM protein [Armatimonadota bacterium]